MTAPLRFQTKLLCFSLLYLFTSLFLALYTSLTATKCIIQTHSLELIPKPLFSYPKGYGQLKYLIPTIHSSCNSPLQFQIFHRDAASFLYFHLSSDLKLDTDRLAMEKCDEVVVVSAVFGGHDEIRQPRSFGSGNLEIVCFFMFIDDVTLQSLNSYNILVNATTKDRLGVLRVVRVLGELPYRNLFSCLVFNELEAFNRRDQLAFAHVRDFMKPRLKINMFEAEVFEHKAMEYRHNLKRNAKASPTSFPFFSKERLLLKKGRS